MFSLFDLTGSLHQIPVHPDTAPLTAFATQTRLFEWLRMPMGASQSAGHFVRVINHVIKGIECVEAYLDDVVVFNETPEQHVQSMRNFSTDSRLTTSSCLDPQRSAPPTRKFLGHIITPDGVSPNPDKVAALTKMTMSTAPLAPRRSGLLPQLPQEHGQTHQTSQRLASKRRTFRFHRRDGGHPSRITRETFSSACSSLAGLGCYRGSFTIVSSTLRRQY